MKQTFLLTSILCMLMSSNVMAENPNKANHSATMPTNQADNNQQLPTNPIEIIIQDHNHIRQMIKRLEASLNSNDPTKTRTQFKELKEFLVQHETMEEKVWYPKLAKNAPLKKIIAQLEREENSASQELRKLDNGNEQTDWTPKVRKLMKDVEQHANNEETKLFPLVRENFNAAALDEIGEKLKEYRTKNNIKY